jgi:hypothetical protein
MDLRADLLAELQKGIDHVTAREKINYRWMYVLVVLSLCAGLAAVVVACLDKVPNYYRGIVAALASLAALFGESLQLNEKAGWNFRKQIALQSLSTKLRFQGAEVAAVSAEWSRLEAQFAKEWPGLKPPRGGGAGRTTSGTAPEPPSTISA